MTIQLERFAYHFVDKHSATLRCGSAAEQDLRRVDPAICQFFADLTADFWDAEDSGVTVSGVFAPGASAVQSLAGQIIAAPEAFFAGSVRLAELLFDKSPTNASPGVLVILLCLHLETSVRCLAIYKLKYRDESVVRLLEGDQVPQLEVEQIRNMLLKELQKGALIPHPLRREYHLKVTDRQGDEPAAYFREKFLGCLTKKSDEHQVRKLISELEQYAAAAGLNLAPSRLLAVLADLRKSVESVTPQALAGAVEHRGLFGAGFSRDDFLVYLANNDNLRDFNIAPGNFAHSKTTLRKVTFEFTHGPLANLVLSAPPEVLRQIISEDGDTVTFTIRTTASGYTCSYE